jgi:GT2 family glycosyltransferase
MSGEPPPEVMRLVAERSAHRTARNYPAADAVRDRLHELGWEVVDGPDGSSVRPMLPQRGALSGVGRQDLTSLLDEQAAVDVSLQVLVDDDPGELRRFLGGLAGNRPPARSHEIVLVANAPSFDVPALLSSQPELPVEVVGTGQRLGWADARNLGLRRSRGEITVICDASVEPLGDFVTPLTAAFDDPAVGLAGPWGMSSGDARRFVDGRPGEVDALQAYCLAVRRAVLREAGLFDRRFRFYRNADLDFSFQARAAGWRAVQVADLPLRRHRPHAYAALPSDELERLSRRNFYRFLKRWGSRRDLLLQPDQRDEH